MQWVYRYHKFGNHIHFVGDNKASAQMMGINVDRVKIIAFVQLGFFQLLLEYLQCMKCYIFGQLKVLD